MVKEECGGTVDEHVLEAWLSGVGLARDDPSLLEELLALRLGNGGKA